MVQKMNPKMRPTGYSESQRCNLSSTSRANDANGQFDAAGNYVVQTPQGRSPGPRTNAASIKGR